MFGRALIIISPMQKRHCFCHEVAECKIQNATAESSQPKLTGAIGAHFAYYPGNFARPL
jgi:hypothetical protein